MLPENEKGTALGAGSAAIKLVRRPGVAIRGRKIAKGTGMTRRRLIAGNWKMFGNRAALAELTPIAAAAAAPGVDVAVAVPFTLIAPAAELVPTLHIGAEDIHEA